MSSKIRLAVVGTGHLGRFHAKLAAGIDSFQLVGLVDPQTAATQSLADELGVEAHADVGPLVGRIDAAVVATPTQFHHAVGRQLLDRGVHLLIEKPLAASAAEAERLVDAARAGNCVLQVGHVERFNPALNAARPHIRAPKYIEARRYSGYSFRSTDIGVVLDVMIHDLDLILWLVQSAPVTVDAMGVSVMGQQEDVANARIVFANGCIANVSASRVSCTMQREMGVWCPETYVSIDYAGPTTTIIRPTTRLFDNPPDAEQMSAEQKLAAKDRLFQDYFHVEKVQPESRNALADELRDFAQAIHSGRLPQVPGTAGLDALSLCEKILDSIQRHRWDGRPDGRIGPLAAWSAPTLPGPYLDPDAPAPRRRAG